MASDEQLANRPGDHEHAPPSRHDMDPCGTLAISDLSQAS